jgi:hypothetical protein
MALQLLNLGVLAVLAVAAQVALAVAHRLL